MADAVRAAAIIGLSITIAIGLFLVGNGDWYLALIGLLGIGLIYFYTSKITHHAWLCLIAPGLAFGPLMMGGAYLAFGGQKGLGVFMVSLMVFFLVNNLLLLNQFPDLEADKRFGRLHLPILIGRQNATWFFVIFLVAAYLILLTGVWLKVLSVYSLLGGLTVLIAIPVANKVIQHAEHVELIKPTMALNVAIALATPVLVAIGIILPDWI
jgi:1,4-dihydroxy-2-naphthoate octaprenyltransferase